MSEDKEPIAPPSPEAPTAGLMRRLLSRRWVRWTLGIMASLFAAFVLLIWTILMPVGLLDLTVNGSRYNRVIEKARSLTKNTSDSVWFHGDWEHDRGGFGAPNICARRTESGELFVRILVVDRHRLGKFGYVYSESSYASGNELERVIDFYDCGEWYFSGDLGGGWWAIENNLG